MASAPTRAVSTIIGVRWVAGCAPQLLDQGQPVLAGQHHIGDHHIRDVGWSAGQLQRGFGIGDGVHQPPVTGEEPGQEFPQIGVILDDQHRWSRLPMERLVGCRGGAAGGHGWTWR